MRKEINRREFFKILAGGAVAGARVLAGGAVPQPFGDLYGSIAKQAEREAALEPLQNRMTHWKYFAIPKEFRSNGSFMDLKIKESPIEYKDEVMKLGGEDINSGTQAAVIGIFLSQATDNRVFLKAFPPEEGHYSFQKRCLNGQETLNDGLQGLLVQVGNMEGAEIILHLDDKDGHGTGRSLKITQEDLEKAPDLDLLMIVLPKQSTSDRMSYVQGNSPDLYNEDLEPIGNIGFLVLGRKGGESNGVMVTNKGIHGMSMESCGEENNDLGKLVVAVPVEMFTKSKGPLSIKFWVNDTLKGPAGPSYELNFRQNQFEKTVETYFEELKTK